MAAQIQTLLAIQVAFHTCLCPCVTLDSVCVMPMLSEGGATPVIFIGYKAAVCRVTNQVLHIFLLLLAPQRRVGDPRLNSLNM